MSLKDHRPMDDRNNEILTIDEVADLLKIPCSSVYRLAQQGKIPAQKVGKHWRFYRPKILKWISGELPRDDSGKAGA